MRIAEQRSLLAIADPEKSTGVSATSSIACQRSRRELRERQPTALVLTKLDELPQAGSSRHSCEKLRCR